MINRYSVFLVCFVLILLTVVAYEPIRHNEFIRFDDTGYITENEHVRSGLSLESVKWAFTAMYSANWHPLTWLSHMLDCELFGVDPVWHHAVNVLFHIANTVLLLWLLYCMTSSFWPSVFVAAAFALHPLHVESVAWAAERKDVLSGFFFMVTLMAYFQYTKRPGIGRYLFVILLFVLGLLAKPMLVTLPFVLLLLDYWPLKRLGADLRSNMDSLAPSSATNPGCPQKSVSWLVIEKIPLLIPVIASSIVTFIAQKNWGAVTSYVKLPLAERVCNASVSMVTYLIKMVYPKGLALLYPFPVNGIAVWKSTAAFCLLLAATVYIFRAARTRRFLLVGWLWYLGMLVPVNGIIRVGEQALADRYTYLPLIGIFIMIGWSIPELFAKVPYKRACVSIAAIVLAVVLVGLTRHQVRYWENNFTLFGHSVDATRNNSIMHYNYGNALTERGRVDEAIEQYNIVLKIKPGDFLSHSNLGALYQLQGRFERAIEHFRKALEIKPEDVQALNHLAVLLQSRGAFWESIVYLKRSLNLNPDQPEMQDKLAEAYYNQGQIDKAIETAETAAGLADLTGNTELVRKIQEHLELYKRSQP